MIIGVRQLKFGVGRALLTKRFFCKTVLCIERTHLAGVRKKFRPAQKFHADKKMPYRVKQSDLSYSHQYGNDADDSASTFSIQSACKIAQNVSGIVSFTLLRFPDKVGQKSLVDAVMTLPEP